MSPLRPPHRVLVSAVLLVYAMSATSCASGWKMQKKPVREVVEPQSVPGKMPPKPPERIRVMRGSQGPTVVAWPDVRNDSLFGSVESTVTVVRWDGTRATQAAAVRPFSAPLDSITLVETFHSTSTQTSLLILGVLALVATGIALAQYAENF